MLGLRTNFFIKTNFITPGLGARVESTPESFSVKNWPVNLLPGKKGLGFPPPRCILHNLVQPEGNFE